MTNPQYPEMLHGIAPTPIERSRYIARIIAATGCGSPGDDPETALVDLLADLMHFARHRGVTFSGVLNTARMHFTAETDERETV